jgi:hypothetical protein
MRIVSRKSLVRGALVASALGAASAAAIQAGCSSTNEPMASQGPDETAGNPSTGSILAPTDNTGTVGMRLTLPGGEQVNSVGWTVTSPNADGGTTVVQTGTVNLQNSETVSFLIGGLPAGDDYTIVLSGTSVDGTATCVGSAQFDTTARTTTNVSVLLQCTTPPSEAGSAQINGTAYSCASVSSISVSPAETTVGHTAAVSATAIGPLGDGGTLQYAWTATSGSFDTPNAASANFTCSAGGAATLTLTVSDGPVPDGGSCNPALMTETVQVQCDVVMAQSLFTTLGAGVLPTAVTINQGTAIGEGTANGSTPFMLTNLAADPNNTQTIASNDGGPPFLGTGTVPDTASGFCNYPADGGAPTRITHNTGPTFVKVTDAGPTDPIVPLTPAYFPLVYNSAVTTSDNAFASGKPPIIGLFDWRPKDIDEGLLAAESDDNGKSWYFMQLVLELDPDYTNPISGGYSPTATATGCPATVTGTNANHVSASGSQDDDGWGHAAIVQLPGSGNSKTGQYLYMLDRNTNNLPDSGVSIVDGAPLWVINLQGTSGNGGASPKFPIWNTNFVVGDGGNTSNNDIKSISSTLNQTPGSIAPIAVTQTVGLTDPDGIMAVFPTASTAAAGSPVTVLWVQKILNGDNTPPTALPVAQQCTPAPFSGKVNHDIATVHIATTTDGVHFTDLGVVNGLSDPTTVDYNRTRWVSPRGTLIDINGNGSLWGLYFSAGNCLDGDSDAFHYIGYAESTDKMNWTVYNDINSPIASINPITTTNQATGQPVTIPAHAPIIPTQPWFAERLYAPTATPIDSTHLSMTFAGYGVQTPNNDLLDYRQIGNVVLTVSQPLPAGVPNNINAH